MKKDRVWIVAEIGCNHNGSEEMAKRMIETAAECGIDAVKFQLFRAGSLISACAPKADYQIKMTGEEETQLEMTAKLELSKEAYLRLRDYAKGLGLEAFATPFDLDAIEFLETHGQKIWKIPSGEITNLPYLERIGSVRGADRQVLLSTGMATTTEIEDCLAVLTGCGMKERQITILHCNTEYPTPDRDVNLLAVRDLKRLFPAYAVGFSDHSAGFTAAAAVVPLGITMIEKHFTLDKNLPGPDQMASATPEEMKELADQVRRVEQMLGAGKKIVTPSERKNKIVARKSIVAKRPIAAGETFTEENITCKRPGNGISPMEWHNVTGKKADRNFAYDELITCKGIKWQE